MNWSAGWLTAEGPPAAVTITSTVPADSAGEVAVMEVVPTTVTPVAATVPNFTVLPALKLVPVMVTEVPPVVGPVLGVTLVTVGAGGGAPVEALRAMADGRGGPRRGLGGGGGDGPGDVGVIGHGVGLGRDRVGEARGGPGRGVVGHQGVAEVELTAGAGVRLGKGTEVEEAPLRVPVLSRAHTVDAPRPALNSWAPYSLESDATELDQPKVMVEAPVVVTLPNQSSSSPPTDPSNCTALVQVLTPPPLTEVTVGPAALVLANTARTSPTVFGDTATVVSPVPVAEARVPTAVMTVEGTL